MPELRIIEPIRGKDGQHTGTNDSSLYGRGSDGGITVSRRSTFLAKAQIADGLASDIKWYPFDEDWGETDLYYSDQGDWVDGDTSNVNVLVTNPPESWGGDFIYDEIYADYAYYQPDVPYPCVHADWWEKIVVNVVSGEAAQQALWMKGICGTRDPNFTKLNAQVKPAGSVNCELPCDEVLTLDTDVGPLCFSIGSIEDDFQDIEDGNRAGRGSYAKWTRRINKNSDGKRVLVVQQDGTKAVFIKLNDTGEWTIKGPYDATLEASGSEFIERVPRAGGWKTAYTYDVYGNMRRIESRCGKVLDYNYDYSVADSGWRGRLQSISGDLAVSPYFEYHTDGRYKCVTLGAFEETGWRAYFEYDGGRVVSVKGPEGCQHEYDWDATNGLVTGVTDPESYSTQLEYGDAYGRVSKIVEPEGRCTYYQRDMNAGTTRVKDIFGRSTYYHYAGAGFDLEEDALGGRVERDFDAYGNAIWEKDQLGHVSYFRFEGYNRVYAKDALGNQSYFRYDPNNWLVAAVDARFNGTYYAYDVYGNQTAVQDALGAATYHVYDSGGHRVATVDALGHGAYFGYDAKGRMTAQMDALANASYYSYDALSRRSKTVDARGNASYFEYDKVGRPTQQKNALLYTRQFGYDGRGLRTVELDELGYSAYYAFNGLRQLTRSTDFGSNATLFGYDLVGNRVRVEDPTGSTTYFHFDAVNRQKCVEDALAAKTYFEYDAAGNQTKVIDPLARASQTFHDELNRVKCSQDALGSQSYFEYDAVGNQFKVVDPLKRVSIAYFDALNRQSCAVDALGAKSYFSYDAVGNQVRVSDKRTFPTYFAYDELNRLAVQWTPEYSYGEQAYGETPYGGVDSTASYFGYDEVGNRVRAMDARGNTAYFHFDKLNRMDWQKDAAGYCSYYEYTARNEQSKVKNSRGAEQQSIFDAAGRLTTSIDPLNVSTYFQYDAAGRQTRRHLAALDQVTYLEHDAVGRQTHLKTTPDGLTILDSQTVYDVAGQVMKQINPRGYAAYFEYDLVGRQQKVKDALLNETYFGYDAVGNRVLAISPRSYASYFGYDALNRLVQGVDAEAVASYFGYDANGNRTAATVGAGAEARTTYFEFDNLNRLTSVTAPDDGVTVFKYDRNGNRVEEVNPLSNSTYYGYDARNLLVRVQDALGQTAYYEYSSTGSLSKSTSPDGRIGNFEYDLAERRTKGYYNDGYASYFAYDAAGNMATAQEATQGTVYFAFDRMNRVTSQKFAVGGAAYYSYDANSNRTQIQYPSGGTAYYTFDALDRMSSVKAPSGNVTSYTFDKSGNRTKSVWGNGAWTYFEFDKAERVSSIRHFDDGGLGIAYFDYGRDGRGNITKIARLGGITTYYGYDEADRLASEDWKSAAGASIYAFEWDYDLAGNRLSGTEQGESIAWAYNAAGAVTRRTDAAGSTYYYYDNDGNLELLQAPAGTVTYFEHGAHGLVTKIKPAGGTEIGFGYDALMRRVRMTEGAVTTYFRHDGINLLEILTSAGSVTKVVHGYRVIDGIGSVVEVSIDGTTYFLHQDHRGTTYLITDIDGNVVWRGPTNAWGLPIFESGSNPSIFWYQGQAWWKLTVNSRLYYISPARIFDVQDGRFLERDPLGKPEFDSQFFYSNRMYSLNVGRFGRRDPRLGEDDLCNAYAGMNGNAVRYGDPMGLVSFVLIKPEMKTEGDFIVETFFIKLEQHKDMGAPGIAKVRFLAGGATLTVRASWREATTREWKNSSSSYTLVGGDLYTDTPRGGDWMLGVLPGRTPYKVTFPKDATDTSVHINISKSQYMAWEWCKEFDCCVEDEVKSKSAENEKKGEKLDDEKHAGIRRDALVKCRPVIDAKCGHTPVFDNSFRVPDFTARGNLNWGE